MDGAIYHKREHDQFKNRVQVARTCGVEEVLLEAPSLTHPAMPNKSVAGSRVRRVGPVGHNLQMGRQQKRRYWEEFGRSSVGNVI